MKAAYADEDYKLFKRWLSKNDIVCVWCETARALTPDHEPPVGLFETVGDWKEAGGELLPACDKCNKIRGARFKGHLTRVRKGRVKRSAAVYPASTW